MVFLFKLADGLPLVFLVFEIREEWLESNRLCMDRTGVPASLGLWLWSGVCRPSETGLSWKTRVGLFREREAGFGLDATEDFFGVALPRVDALDFFEMVTFGDFLPRGLDCLDLFETEILDDLFRGLVTLVDWLPRATGDGVLTPVELLPRGLDSFGDLFGDDLGDWIPLDALDILDVLKDSFGAFLPLRFGVGNFGDRFPDTLEVLPVGFLSDSLRRLDSMDRLPLAVETFGDGRPRDCFLGGLETLD